MNQPLSPTLQKLIADRLATGEYRDEEHVLFAALRKLEQSDQLYEAWLKQEVRRGVEEADRGEGEPYDMDRIQAELDAERT